MSTPNQHRDPLAPSPGPRLMVYVPVELRRAGVVQHLRQYAQEVGRSPSAIIMAAVTEYLQQHGAIAADGPWST